MESGNQGMERKANEPEMCKSLENFLAPSGVSRVCDGFSTISWAYGFLYINVMFGRLNVLPNWMGYLLLREACDEIGGEEKDVLLLKPLAALLAAYEGVLWLCVLFDISFYFPAADVVVTVVSLYFHYQLITDLGNLAERFHSPRAKRFRYLRIGQAVFTTLLGFPAVRQAGGWVPKALMAASLAVFIFIRGLAAHLEELLKEQAGEPEQK